MVFSGVALGCWGAWDATNGASAICGGNDGNGHLGKRRQQCTSSIIPSSQAGSSIFFYERPCGKTHPMAPRRISPRCGCRPHHSAPVSKKDALRCTEMEA